MKVERRPTFTLSEVEALALEHYALRASASPLPSERDQNFKLVAEGSGAYVLKVAHPDESLAFLDAQWQVLDKLAALPRKVFPHVLPTLKGDRFARAEGESDLSYPIWLIPFMNGEPVAGVSELSKPLLHDIGQTLAEMDRALAHVHHPALRRTFQWAAQSAPEVIREKLEHIPDPARRWLLEAFLDTFEAEVGPHLSDLRQSVVHNDVNDYNLLVSGDDVSAVLDFGDLLTSYTLCDPAHACAYLMLDQPEPLRVALSVLRGYQAVYSLTETELHVFYDFVRLRLALSVSISAYQQGLEPDNPYLSISERPAWALLERLNELGPGAVRRQFVALAEKAVAP